MTSLMVFGGGVKEVPSNEAVIRLASSNDTVV